MWFRSRAMIASIAAVPFNDDEIRSSWATSYSASLAAPLWQGPGHPRSQRDLGRIQGRGSKTVLPAKAAPGHLQAGSEPGT